MSGDLLVRFLVGGAIVSAFAAAGELFTPQTFSGVFGAAPSVALATLALAYHDDGAHAVVVKAWWMALGAIALLVYGLGCVVLTRRKRVPVWLAAGLAWSVWLGAASTLWLACRDLWPS